jgi:putative nucleotidyltransferase with HDIG domain
MMSIPSVNREKVIQMSRSLSSFPAAVAKILALLDDPDAGFDVVVETISMDALISARVLSVANSVAMRSHRDQEVCDIKLATALIGMDRVRHITLISSLSSFIVKAGRSGAGASFWQHSVSVGVCAEELAHHVDTPVSATMALVAGLLHDIGQLWLLHYDADQAQICWREARRQDVGVEQLERQYFGVDHSTIGAWLASHWRLPTDVVDAISAHHQPDAQLSPPLVPLLHVAEVLSNALDLGQREDNRVTYLSAPACAALGLVWDDSIRPLFGRIEARSRHANAIFAPSAPA